MSKVAIKGASTGTATFTLEAPATNTDRTLVLPDNAGTVLTSASDLAGVTGVGKVLQVVSTTKTDTFSAALSGAGAESGTVTGLTVSITPFSASSKVLVRVFVNLGVESHTLPGVGITLFRNSTKIGIGADTSSTRVSSATYFLEGESRTVTNVAFEIKDEPSTTSEITYSIKLVRQSAAAGTNNFYVNRADSTGTIARFSTASTITAMEVAV